MVRGHGAPGVLGAACIIIPSRGARKARTQEPPVFFLCLVFFLYLLTEDEMDAGVLVLFSLPCVCALQGIKSTSIVFKGSEQVAEDPYALFCAEDRNGCHLEVPREGVARAVRPAVVAAVVFPSLRVAATLGGDVKG